MAIRTSLNVSLTPELDKFVQERVATGRYQTASEGVREGLRLLELQERNREAAFLTLKAKLDRGASQADRGEIVDPDEVLKKIDALKRRRASEKAVKRNFVFTPEAEADALAIWEHLADEDSQAAADRVVGLKFTTSAKSLARCRGWVITARTCSISCTDSGKYGRTSSHIVGRSHQFRSSPLFMGVRDLDAFFSDQATVTGRRAPPIFISSTARTSSSDRPL